MGVRVVPMRSEEWGSLAASFQDLSYRQTPSFVSEMAKLIKGKPEFVALHGDGGLVGLCAVRVKRLPALPFGVAYVLHGPMTMPDRTFSGPTYAACLSALAQHYVKKRMLSLRIVPPFAASRSQTEAMEALASAGFRKLDHKTSRTILLAVDRDLAQIRKGLEQRWRNMLVSAEKVALEIVESTRPDDFRIMAPMHQDLEQKKNFRSGHEVAFFERAQRSAAPFEQVALYLARFEGRAVSAALVSFAGDSAVLLLAATNEEGRRLRASYRIQWRIVQDAIAKGKRWYDLGGVDPDKNPDGYRFKKRMNGVEISELGVFECAPNAIALGAVAFAEQVYRRASRR